MRKREVVLFFVMGSFLLSGCHTTNQDIQQNTDSTASESTSATEIDTSAMFSDRDKEVGYEEEESVAVLLADKGSSCESDSVSIDENVVTITEEGTYILSGSLSDGMVIVDAEDTDKIQLVLDDVSISNSQSAALYIRSADKVFVTTAAGTENELINLGTYIAIDENNIDAAVFSKSDLTLNGEGILTVTAQEGHGIVSKDDLVFTSGDYTITSAKHGISGKDSVRIANGSYKIISGKDGIHGENTEDSSLGFVYLAGGTYSVSSGDDGIHADGNVTISGGSIDILKSYEGIEGLSIDITGGELSVLASDDGMNAAGGNDSSGFDGPGGGGDQFAVTEGAYIHISGGKLHVNASGDGIDSNGDLTVSGGETYVSGPSNDGNGTLDYSGSAVITGGVFAASGSSGMAQSFDDSSTQGCMMVNVEAQEADTDIVLLDDSGNEILRWSAEKAYSSVIISCEEIKEGENYTVKCGETEQSVTMDSLVYGSNSPAGGNPGGGQGGGNRKEDEMRGKPERGQEPGKKENPQESMPPDMPSGGSTENSSLVQTLKKKGFWKSMEQRIV